MCACPKKKAHHIHAHAHTKHLLSVVIWQTVMLKTRLCINQASEARFGLILYVSGPPLRTGQTVYLSADGYLMKHPPPPSDCCHLCILPPACRAHLKPLSLQTQESGSRNANSDAQWLGCKQIKGSSRTWGLRPHNGTKMLRSCSRLDTHSSKASPASINSGYSF